MGVGVFVTSEREKTHPKNMLPMSFPKLEDTPQTRFLAASAGVVVAAGLVYFYATSSGSSTPRVVVPSPSLQKQPTTQLGSPSSKGGASSMPTSSAASHGNLKGANSIPLTEEGRTMHLNVGRGDVAPRVLSVGDVGRAERIATANLSSLRTVSSSRGFVTHTGLYRGKEVSVVATLMGFSNADFVVREMREVVTGPMAVLRLGTCGGLLESMPVGCVAVSRGSVCVRRNPDAAAAPAPYVQHHAIPFSLTEGQGASVMATPSFPFDISGKVSAHPGLTALYVEKLRAAAASTTTTTQQQTPFAVHECVGASSDSFYSSQGRSTQGFSDRNSAVIPTLCAAGVAALEMETFHLLDMARASASGGGGRIFASSAAIVLFNRPSGVSLEGDRVKQMEGICGRAALETLVSFEFP